MDIFITADTAGVWKVESSEGSFYVGINNFAAVAERLIFESGELNIKLKNPKKFKSPNETLELIKLYVTAYQNYNRFRQPDLLTLNNYIDNLAEILHRKKGVGTYEGLKLLMDNKPIVFVGAGPSLNDSIAEIEKIARMDTGIVVAAGSAGRILFNKNIIPHAMIAIDPFDSEWDNVFSHIDPERTKHTILICKGDLNPKCLKIWRGPIVFGGGLSDVSMIGEIDGIPTWPDLSVGCSTSFLSLLQNYIRPKEVVLVGFDLAYEKVGDTLYTYADPDLINLYDVETVKGIPTRALWEVEALSISNLCAMMGRCIVYRQTTVSRQVYPISNTISRDALKSLTWTLNSKYKEVPLNIDFKQALERLDSCKEIIAKSTPDQECLGGWSVILKSLSMKEVDKEKFVSDVKTYMLNKLNELRNILQGEGRE